jgi:hypothetical protein
MTERDERGRFVKGNGGGPGRPKRSREEQYLDVLLGVCTPDEWKIVCAVALSRAKAGDAKAREWLGNYIIGKPIEKHEVSGPDGGAIEVANVAGVTAEDIAEARRILGDPSN